MKKHLLSALFLLCSLSVTEAQDIIAHRDGNVSTGKVVEISKDEVKYRKSDNPDGPLYSIPVKDLLSVRFENGTQEIFAEKKQQPILEVRELDDDDDDDVAYMMRPEIRLRMDTPCSDNLDGGGGLMGVAGVQINRSLSMGPGLGFIWHRYYTEKIHSLECPVFLQIRAMIPTQTVSPYFIGQAGYSFGRLHHTAKLLPEDESKRLGAFCSLGAGFRIKLKRGSIFMDLTWNAQKWRNDVLDEPQSFGLSGGYFFERRR